MFYGADEINKLKSSIFTSLWFIGLITAIINIFSLLFIDEILMFMKIPIDIYDDTREYVQIIFYGIALLFYNYFCCLECSNSVFPLYFLL